MAEPSGKQLLDLLTGALQVDPDSREAWLQDACQGDETLRAGVLSLLAHDTQADLLFGDDAADEASVGVAPTAPAAAASADLLNAGDRLGDYSIETLIGAGGMGVVYRARQHSLNRTVALKVLPHHLRRSSRGLKRFRREVEAAARLHHPNIVTVFASGDEGDTAYYAMEYVEGPSLSQVVEAFRSDPIIAVQDCVPDTARSASADSRIDAAPLRSCALLPTNEGSKPLSDDEYFARVARLLAGVADGLHYAHTIDIVHRDIKPSNLWFSGDGRLRIGDFGLARVASEPGMTQTGEVVGTPYYMAPEQLSGRAEEIDARTDVYAVGATLYELLTLQPPFPGETRDGVLARIAGEEPQPPRRLNRRTPRDLETVCLKALEKRPTDRYASAAAMAEDLRRFADRLPVTARRAGLIHRGLRWCGRHPSLATAVFASIVLAGAAVALAMRAQHLAVSQSEATNRAAVATTNLQEAEAQIAAANESEQQRLFQAALLAGMQGDAAAVSRELRRAEALGASESRLGIARGQVHLFDGAFDAAIDEFATAAEQMPNRVAPRALLAEAYVRAGLYTTAAAVRAEAVALPAESVEELILLGRMELQFDPPLALKALDEAIEQDRRNIVARLIRGSARTQVAYLETDRAEAEDALDDLRLAESLLDETPYLLSQFVNSHLVASACYESLGETATAERHRDKAGDFAERLGRYPGNYEAHRWRAYYYERVGDLNAAIEEWRAIDDKTIGYLIMCLYRAGRFDEAIAACDEYRTHASTGTADFCSSFVQAAVVDRPEPLIAGFRFENQLRWDPTSAWTGLHTLWRLAGKPERAVEAIRKLPPPDEATGAMRAMQSYLVGDLAASDYLTAVAGETRAEAWAHLLIGIEHLGAGDRPRARERFERVEALRLDYEFSTAVSRALITQLGRAPDWPPWIPGAADVTEQPASGGDR